MTVPGPAPRAVRKAEEVQAMPPDAVNRGDSDPLVAIYEDDATPPIPPGGRSRHGHDELRSSKLTVQSQCLEVAP